MNILLLCPHFMGYDELLSEALKIENDVSYIDTERFLAVKRKAYYDKNVLLKAFFKLFRNCRDKYREKMLSDYDNNYIELLDSFPEKKFDIVLAINGDGISNYVYTYIKKNNPNARFILYIWDDYSWLFKQNHIKFFDKVSSYNINDCKKYGFLYNPVFTQALSSEMVSVKKYDIAIIATANKERVKFAKNIYEKYKDKYTFYIYFYCNDDTFDFFSHKNPLSYEKYMQKISESRAVLDIVRHNQKGPTTRMSDSIAVKTKVITMNKNIVDYPMFNSNFLVLDKKLNIPMKFIKNEYEESAYKPLNGYQWCKRLMSEE